jgi:hypothetical protein
MRRITIGAGMHRQHIHAGTHRSQGSHVRNRRRMLGKLRNRQRPATIMPATTGRLKLRFVRSMAMHPLPHTTGVHGRCTHRQRRGGQHSNQRKHQQKSSCPTMNQKNPTQ